MLTMNANGQGTIYYTTDGVTDPRLIGGELNPSSAVKTYSSPIAITDGQVIKARIRTTAGAWSVLVEATFDVSQAGDYSGDGAVDGSDFLLWQRQFGASVSPVGSGADGDHSGVVDAADLAVWRDHFGEVPAFVAEAFAASENSPAIVAASHDQAARQAFYAAGDLTALFSDARSHRSARRLRIRI
jgi:hypothetical protein